MDDTELILIRHAQSQLNAEQRWQGRSDSPLSALGREQALALARELRDLRLDAVVASPLARAVATAEPLAAGRGLAIELAPALSELDVGHWGGRTREEIACAWPEELVRFDAEDLDARAPGGESRREVGRRVGVAVAALAQRYASRRIAVVTHLGVILALVPGLRLANARHHRVAARDLDLSALREHGIAQRAMGRS
jgi:broad specificity phosphatase PhoE